MKNEKGILLVEDQFFNLRHLKNEIEKLGYSVTGTAMNTAAAEKLLQENEFGLAILDINLGEDEKTGIWLADKINKEYNIPIIFLTAYVSKEIIDKAVATKPSAYLTKPFNTASLQAAIELATIHQTNIEKEEPYIFVKENGFKVKLYLKHIIFIESDKNYVKIHTTKNIVYKLRKTIKETFTLLNKDFIKPQRSFIINKTKIKKHSTNTLILKGGHEIKIPEKLRKEFLSQID